MLPEILIQPRRKAQREEADSMTEFDPKIIQQFADDLYSKALSICATYTMLGLLAGFILGYFLGAVLIPRLGGIGELSEGATVFWVLGPTALLGVGSFALAREKTFQLRLQAQTALCQIKLESHLRSMCEQLSLLRRQ